MTFRIGEWEVRPETREILQGDRVVRLSLKAMGVLLALRDADGGVLSRSELLNLVWPGTTVGEEVLTHAIAELRKALGDPARKPRFIETIHKTGYRLLDAPATAGAEGMASPSAPARGAASPSSEHGAGERSLGAQVFDGALGLDLSLPKRPSIAVLPFRAVADEKMGQLLAEGLSRDIMVGLARTRWLFVASRASAGALRARDMASDEIATQLGIRYLLDGSVMVSGERLRLTVFLTDCLEGREILAERFDSAIRDIYDLMDDVAGRVTLAVQTEIGLHERRRALLYPVNSLDAWGAYHRATHHLFRYRSSDLDEAASLLRRASELDPTSGRILAGLSLVHWRRAVFEIGEGWTAELERALRTAQESIQRDYRDAHGYWMLGRTLGLMGDREQGMRQIREAIALNPCFPYSHFSLAYLLMFEGRYEEGIESVDQARRLSPYDPMNFGFFAVRAQNLALAGRSEEAVDWAERSLNQQNASQHNHLIAAFCNELDGRRARAEQHLANALRVHPEASRDQFLRAYPFRGKDRDTIDQALLRLGLRG